MRAKASPQRVVLRSRICLVAAEGLPLTRWPIAGRPRVPPWAVADTVQRSGTRRVYPRVPRMGQCPPPVAPKSPSQRGGHAAEDAARAGPLYDPGQ